MERTVKYPYVTGLLETNKPDIEFMRELTARPKNISLFFSPECSLKCPYCSSKLYQKGLQKTLKSKVIIDKIGIKRYIENVSRLIEPYMPLRVTLAGTGEPTESPHFFKLANTFLEMGNQVHIQTNLLHSKVIETFLRSFSKDDVAERVSFLASYHLGAFLDMDEGKTLRQRFLKVHYPRIAKYNCKMIMVTPMTPKVLKDKNFIGDFEYMSTLYPNPERFIAYPLELGAIYQEKRWPGSYTESERLRVYELLDKTNSLRTVPTNSDMLKNMNNFLYLKHMPCHVRTKNILVGIDGDIWYCTKNKEDIIGNIANVKKLNYPYDNYQILCPQDKCNCKAFGYSYCLFPNGISIEEYYAEYAKVKGISLDIQLQTKSGKSNHHVEVFL